MKVEHRLDGVSKSKVPIKIVDEEIPEQMKEDLSHIQCFRSQKFGHYAIQCRNSKKRRHQASTIDVDEEAQHEESQALTSHVKKGKGKGRKFHNKKDKGGRSSPILERKKKKDLSHIQCFKCHKYGHYAKQCHGSNKREHEASTADIDEDTSQEAKE